MKLIYATFVLSFYVQWNIVLIQSSEGLGLGLKEFMDIVTSNDENNLMPIPPNIFQISKQVLIGLPEISLFKTYHTLCSLYMVAKELEPSVTPDVKSMALILHKPCVTAGFPLTNAAAILESADFEISNKVVIFVTGWMADLSAEYISNMAAAFNCRGNYNFLVLDTSEYISTLYEWSAYNTAVVGQILANTLEILHKKVPVKNIHLVGYSLGAHIVGYAGRYFNRQTGLHITRITGLDPANPCFSEGHILSGLQRGDADFVDVIHTNPRVLGKATPMGDADFYPEGLAPIKPGCLKLGCSHRRAPEYFTESVYPGNEHNFLAVRCTSMIDFKIGFCDGFKFPMGFAVPFNLKGNFFLSVNAEKPYGKHSTSKYKVVNGCGKCRK